MMRLMDNYRFDTMIGQGGSARVYRGWKRLKDGSDERVALKRLKPQYLNVTEAQDRFRREVEIAVEFDHANIVYVHDYEFNDGNPIIAMEYIDGLTLEQLAQRVVLSPATVRRILRGIINGLRHVHERGVLHRDISLRNIMITRTGVVKLMDFGLAWQSDGPETEGLFKGTAAFAAPDVLFCQRWSKQTDWYAVGAVLYRLLTTTFPHGSGNRNQVATRHTLEGPVRRIPGDIPDDLRRFVLVCLRPPNERTDDDIDQALAEFEESKQPMLTVQELGALVDSALQQGAPVAQPNSASIEHRVAPGVATERAQHHVRLAVGDAAGARPRTRPRRDAEYASNSGAREQARRRWLWVVAALCVCFGLAMSLRPNEVHVYHYDHHSEPANPSTESPEQERPIRSADVSPLNTSTASTTVTTSPTTTTTAAENHHSVAPQRHQRWQRKLHRTRPDACSNDEFCYVAPRRSSPKTASSYQ